MEKIRFLMECLRALVEAAVIHMPGEAGRRLRRRYWRGRLRFLGEDVVIDPGVHFQNPGWIALDDRCWVDRNVTILAGPDNARSREKTSLANPDYPGAPGVVHVGKRVHVGVGSVLSGISAGIYISDDCGLTPYCRLYAFTHHYRSLKRPWNRDVRCGSSMPPESQVVLEGPVFLARNVAVAMGSTILPGVSILEDSGVAVNAVVKDGRYGPNVLLGGSPAEKVGDRFPPVPAALQGVPS